MDSFEEIQRRYLQGLRAQEKKELENYSKAIQEFLSYCQKKNIEIDNRNIEYIPTIGIVAVKKNIVSLLNREIGTNKEGLISKHQLENLPSSKRHMAGLSFDDKYIVLPHHYFRRGYHPNSNFSPKLIDELYRLNDPNIIPHIALDQNRVRINLDTRMYLEADTWYGAKFERKISNISDGLVKLRPPIELDDSLIRFFFNDAYGLDIKWETSGQIKTFQAEEFKTESVTINIEGEDFFPVRYIHAEYDLERQTIQHFDGAIHLYSFDDYVDRRDTDLNFNIKNSNHIKAGSVKLFKLDGKIDVDLWVELSCHFFTGNPLVHEYFEGELPSKIKDILETISST